MKFFQLEALLDQLSDDRASSWLEFLRTGSLSMGLYRLKAGSSDPQLPHSEDEVYYVLAGSAKFRAGADEHAQAGSIFHVDRL